MAEWAVPVVPVLKSDKKSVQLCGDFKMMVNQASRLDTVCAKKKSLDFLSVLNYAQYYLQYYAQ